MKLLLVGFLHGGYSELLDKYRNWKASRTSIPMMRTKDGVYIADGRLKRFERWFKIAVVTFAGLLILSGWVLIAGMSGMFGH